MKNFLERSWVHASWTPEKDDQLLPDFLTIGPRWKFLSKR
jgi:hypothetical protein